MGSPSQGLEGTQKWGGLGEQAGEASCLRTVTPGKVTGAGVLFVALAGLLVLFIVFWMFGWL